MYTCKRCEGNEKIIGLDVQLMEFWQWAYSDVMNNAERGVFAEWLVSKALSAADGLRIEWDKYDILTPDNIRVEVKTSGYLQSWTQKTMSRLVFDIAPKLGWDKDTNTYDTEKKRQADIYVFCVHSCTDPEKVNPTDLSQWEFYVMSTTDINNKLGVQKTAALSKLIANGAMKCAYSDLKKCVTDTYYYERS